jgi:hypothetical protein
MKEEIANFLWSVAAVVGAMGLAFLGLSAAAIALAFAVPVIAHGTLAGVALAPELAAFAAAGVGTTGVADERQPQIAKDSLQGGRLRRPGSGVIVLRREAPEGTRP